MTRSMIPAVVVFLLAASSAAAQTQPTAAERAKWAKSPNALLLESSSCKKITWLLEADRSKPTNEQHFHHAVGWWGRGFVEGAVYILGEKAQKAASDFGLSVDVVAAHVSTYCYAHQTDTPLDAIQDLLLKVLKSGPSEGE